MTEKNSIDINCSNACTRAGITTLLFSILLLTLISPLKLTRSNEALGEYLIARLVLMTEINNLLDSDCWKHVSELKIFNEIKNQWSLNKVKKIKCTEDGVDLSSILYKKTSETEIVEKETVELVSQNKLIGPVVPVTLPPPSGLKIIFLRDIESVSEIIDVMFKLNDRNMIDKARSLSLFYNVELRKWQVNLYKRLGINANFFKSSSSEKVIKSEEGKKISTEKLGDAVEGKNSNIDRFTLASILTINNIIELSKKYPPSDKDLDTFDKSRSTLKILSTGGSVRISDAVVFIASILIVSMFYFFVYLREAKKSSNYPSEGTLFSVMNNDILSKAFYMFLILTPLVSMLVITYLSFPENIYYFVFVIILFLITYKIIKEERLYELVGWTNGSEYLKHKKT